MIVMMLMTVEGGHYGFDWRGIVVALPLLNQPHELRVWTAYGREISVVLKHFRFCRAVVSR